MKNKHILFLLALFIGVSMANYASASFGPKNDDMKRGGQNGVMDGIGQGMQGQGQGQGQGMGQSNGNNNPQGIGNPMANRPFIKGDVVSIDGTSIVISSKLFDKDSGSEAKTVNYTVDASSAKFYTDGVESKISSVVVGDTIMVEGEVSGESIKATIIHEGNMGVGNRANLGDGNNVQERQKNNRSFWGRVGNFFSNMFGKKNQ